MVGFEVLDQAEEDARFVFFADRPAVVVMRLGLASIGLVVEHHVELWVQVFDGLGKGRGGGQRAVDQNDGLVRLGVGVELRVDLVLPV